MHPPDVALILAGAASAASAFAAILARWRDLSSLALTLCGAVVVTQPTALPATAPAALLLLVGAVRGARSGVGRPELASLALLASIGAGVVAQRIPAQGGTAAAALVTVGVALGLLATTRRTTVWIRPRFVGEVPVRGPTS